MQKRLIQALLFLGVISIPSFASAEGGLLSNVTDGVNAVTDHATTTVNKAVSAPDEEKDKSSEDGQQSKGNILSNTVDSVTDTVDETTESVTGIVNAATKTVGNTANKTVEQATKPVTDIAGDSAAPVAEA
ncbi:hypothetical protein NQ095_11385, partial [Rossellomorea sp. SC111]|uniref:hypothetical protein n=1 Tax=Rossellomorea sp. SC111 TaxID=2968985 RepID=UPI00215B575D